jgi:hypothetical protein
VRFSPDGRLLASGSDDKAVLIYKLEPSSSGAAPPRGNFGSSDPPPLENWKLCQTLKVRHPSARPPVSTRTVGSKKSRWVTLGDAKSSLGDAESSLGDDKSSLGDDKSSLGDAKELAG